MSIDEEQSKELLVLKVCLAKIERSRPFLIVLIGDRYGWIPPPERMAAAAKEADFAGDLIGKSITALEIEYGILQMPGQRQRSTFYIRQPLPYDSMPAEIAAIYSDRHSPLSGGEESHQRLQALKHRIRKDRQLKDRVRDYSAQWDEQKLQVTGLEEWGRLVLEDLWRDLEEETRAFLHAPIPSWQEQERWALEEFVHNRSRGFVGRQEITDELVQHALSDKDAGGPKQLCLIGEPGSGKSALFSHLYLQLQKQDVLLLASAAGISLRSAEVDAILQRWIEELAQFLKIASPLPEKPSSDDLLEQFTLLLGRAAVKKRVVVLLDALNQLEQTPRARRLTLLPKLWPENTRLLATALPGEETDALSAIPGTAVKTLPPLQQAEARDIIDTICRRYHRTLHPQVAEVLLQKKTDAGHPSCGNPLWLELAVEELNLLDADDFSRAEREYRGTPEEKLHRLLVDTAESLPPTVENLYDWMLQRAEEIQGVDWCRGLSVAIALSRSGWRESDLRELVPLFSNEPWDELRFAVLRRSFRAHLVRRGALARYDFFHQQMRLAVEQRYLDDREQVKQWHNQIADYLSTLASTDPLRQNERMVHLIAADNSSAAARYYAADLQEDELAGATRALAGHILEQVSNEPNPVLRWILGWLEDDSLTDGQRVMISRHFNFDLNDRLENQAPLKVRQELLLAAGNVFEKLAAADPSNSSWQRDLAAAHCFIGMVLQQQGKLEESLNSYKKYQMGMEKLAAADPSNSSWQRDLSVSFEKMGDVFRAQGDLAQAIKAYQNSLQIAEKLAAADPSNSEWQRDLSVSFNKVGDV
ncbi:AAA family ATPase, partial [candidate division KSB1 bacterium]|nr:AAA family ATPase [candidate division KSB1 bacterium]